MSRSFEDFPLYQTKTAHGLHWLKIFYQNSKYCYFENKNPKFSFENGCYSILSIINESFKFNNAYEFLLEYPDNKLIVNNEYNHWRQSASPLEIAPKPSEYVLGYEPIHISWLYPKNDPIAKFTGLSLSKNAFSLIDGTSILSDSDQYDYWYFAIGVISIDGPTGKIPGYSWENTEVELWLRINFPEPSKKCLSRATVISVFSLLMR